MIRVPYIVLLFICLILNDSCKQEKSKEGLTVCFTGDVLLDRGVRKEIERKGSPDFLLENVSTLFKSSDAVVINLECPTTKIEAPINKRFIFRGEPEWLQSLHNAGVTHAALANNHSMDQGRRGLTDTHGHLAEVGIQGIGYGSDQLSACEPIFISKDNTEVAIFNSVQLGLENWVYLEDEPGVCQSSIASLCESIKLLKEKNAVCHIVVVLHWGAEYQQEPSISQRNDAYRLIDAGADAIIGHHPHVVQKEEIYKGKPIFYSLGNFIFDQNKPLTNKSVIVQLIFDKDGVSFKKYSVDIKDCKPHL